MKRYIECYHEKVKFEIQIIILTEEEKDNIPQITVIHLHCIFECRRFDMIKYRGTTAYQWNSEVVTVHCDVCCKS